MSIELTWHGHATWVIKSEKHSIVIDPFFDDNPSSKIKASDVQADFIVVSHGHFDHIADCASIANRLNIPVFSVYEIATWLGEKHGVQNCVGMNLGGSTTQEFGSLKLTPAWHSSQLPDGSYGGNPAGLLFNIEDVNLYFACDTALFSDMKLIGEEGIHVAILPIGDLFTMGVEESVTAINWIKPRIVLPTHYDTWPPIEQDAQAWAARVRVSTPAYPVVLQSGESYTI